MRSPLPSIRARLVGDAPLLGLLGGAYRGAPKVYMVEPLQGAPLPYVRIYEVSGTPLGESLAMQTPPWEKRVSVDVAAGLFEAADAIGSRIIILLTGLSGEIGEFVFQDSRVVSDVPFFEDESRINRRVVDFRVVYSPVS